MTRLLSALAIVLVGGASIAARAQATPPEGTPPEGAPAASMPPEGAWLRYRYVETLRQGAGEYEGYSESTTADARYDVVSADPAEVAIHGQYTWTYRSPERNETQSVDRTVTFSLPERLYTSAQTDSSDYDAEDARSLATWIWIPPSIAAGERVRILDHELEVVGPETIPIGGAPREAIHLAARYEGRRDDDYGQYATSTRDDYWFDRATGMFLREEVDEHDQGTLEGRPASFHLVTTIEVIDASYAPSVVPIPDPAPVPDLAVPPAPRYDGDSEEYDAWRDRRRRDRWLCFAAVAVPLALVLLFLFGRRGARFSGGGPRTMADGTAIDVQPVADPATLALPRAISPRYHPFLAHFAAIAAKAGNPVLVARRGDGTIVGFAFGDRETDVGSIFAPDSDVCEALRLRIGHSEIFSETRHPGLASVKRAGLASPEHAYNVYETFEVMTLESAPEDLGYDRDTVRRMTPEHRAGVVELLRLAYGVPCEKWLDAAIDAGDLAWVATDGGRVVGVAMASLCGDQAHLHALTVHPDARNRGLGTGLMRARLRALFDLGARTIVTECATWNLAAREVASRHGFQKVGEMYVESSDPAREQRKIVRR